jgi:phage-related minor tail protein
MREWNVTAPLPPRFQEGVWHRIERAESNAAPEAMTTLWSVIKGWLVAALPRPAVAVTYLTVLFVAGMAVGYWQGQSQSAHWEKDLGLRYVQSVDPYQKPPRIAP